MYVVGGTTQFGTTLNEVEVELPSSGVRKPFGRVINVPRRHPTTRLVWRTVVDCTWVVPLNESEVLNTGGTVPSSKMLEIVERARNHPPE
jgi:hypothetical protein